MHVIHLVPRNPETAVAPRKSKGSTCPWLLCSVGRDTSACSALKPPASLRGLLYGMCAWPVRAFGARVVPEHGLVLLGLKSLREASGMGAKLGPFGTALRGPESLKTLDFPTSGNIPESWELPEIRRFLFPTTSLVNPFGGANRLLRDKCCTDVGQTWLGPQCASLTEVVA